MNTSKQVHQSIIDQCKNNHAKAQMQLYNLYCKSMFLVAYRYVKDQFIAEDVMQDAFIKAFKNIHSFKGEVAFGAWLKKIVINQSIDQLKRKTLEVVTLHEELTIVIDDDEHWDFDDEVLVREIVTVIKTLKEKYRLVLSLYLLEGYDHKEISEVLHITETTSRTHLARGKKLVKEQLKARCYAAKK